ncbi:MAG: hypothetical protein DRQ48_11400 [Gammaproteobacteria bacterium]|nr:MAG: hypothetical protein DRQ48_11400 [Gammaproteobacteria bacterium]
MRTDVSKTPTGFRFETDSIGVVLVDPCKAGWVVTCPKINRRIHGAVGEFGTHPQLIQAMREARYLSRESFDMWRSETEGNCPPVPQEFMHTVSELMVAQ